MCQMPYEHSDPSKALVTPNSTLETSEEHSNDACQCSTTVGVPPIHVFYIWHLSCAMYVKKGIPSLFDVEEGSRQNHSPRSQCRQASG